MKKTLALKNKKRMNKEMKEVTIATWCWKQRRSLFPLKNEKYGRYKNLCKALRMDFRIALKNFERGNT